MNRVILPAGATRFTVRSHLNRILDGLASNLDFTVTIAERGEERTQAQNRLQQLWHLQAAEQLQDATAEDKRAYCKLHFGVPILRNEDEHFKAEYDRVIRPLDYETKLSLMKVPFDFPVTRLMTVKQKKRFLDAIHEYYTGLGVRLSHPDDLGRAA